MIRSILSIVLIMMFASCQQEIVEDENLVENLMKTDKEKFGDILNNPNYEVQILYTQINRDSANNPQFKSFSYQLNPEQYFYPASTVKMPIAFLALEKLNELGIQGLDKSTTMLTDSAYSGQSPVASDSTSANGLPSIEHYIKKIFVVSDNDAYNRLYEFLGPEYINQKLTEKGFNNSVIQHRLSIALSSDENMHTNPARFTNGDSIIYSQPLTKSNWSYTPKNEILKGVGYINGSDSLVNEPFNFTYKNWIPLADLQGMLKDLMFPNSSNKFNLKEGDYKFLYQYMSQLPRETSYPDYKADSLPDGYCKFLMYSTEDKIPENIRIFNKIGQAYGYLIDNALIIDFENGVEFLLSAVISVNDNQIYNDGVYEYDEVGMPFMENLGRLIYDYELKRKRAFKPDLSRFRTTYDQ
ncbi:MAG: serine hydrolase [Fulvivirga sp.]